MNLRSKTVRILALLVAVAVTGTLAYALSNARKGYEPRQPILFRHTRMAGAPVWQTNDKGEKVNVGGFGIPCVYCHTMPYKGRHSTVPSTAVCMNCHSSVGLNKEWVLKMKEYWDRGEPIPWVKVHDLPDFVYYDHSAHVNAKDDAGQAAAAADRRAGQADGRVPELPRQGRGDGNRLRAAPLQHAVVPRLPPEARDEGVHRLRHVPPVREMTMNPNETSARPDAPGLDRREFLRLSGALAAAGALASAGCQVPQEATVPFHDMPESLVDGIGRARFFHTVIDGSPVLVRTREGRPILVTPSPNDASGRGLSVRHHAALMDLYDPDRARGPLSVRRGNGAPVASSWAAVERRGRLEAEGGRDRRPSCSRARRPARRSRPRSRGSRRRPASGTSSGRRSSPTPPAWPGRRRSATGGSRGPGSTRRT